jgi:predicted enzyme related to lactoylglutathione lyase
MITGVHTLLYHADIEAVRAFFRDVLEWPSVDAGHGWLIFGMPPGEIAVHPTDDDPRTEIYLVCDDLEATMEKLRAKGVAFARPVTDQGWGLVTAINLPGGGELGLYQPRHPNALNMHP